MHSYLLGGSGAGKSTLLKQHILEDINAGHAVCFIDPHGEDINDIIKHIPKHRINDTIVFDPTDPTHYIEWNPLQESKIPPLTATVLSDTIKDAWGYHGMTTPVLDMYLYFTISALIDNDLPFYKSLDILTSKEYRKGLSFTDTVIGKFWLEFDLMTDKEKRDITASTLNKLYTLFGDIRIRRILNIKNARFSVKDAVKDKILLIRLPQGQLGISKVSLIGSMLLSQIHLACLDRDIDLPFCLYVDEVHSFSSSTLTEMYSGLRKYNVHITVAHQYIDQLDKKLFASILANSYYRHIFRVSQEDSRFFKEAFGNWGVQLDLHKIEPFTYRTFPWSRSDRDGETSPLPEPRSQKTAQKILNNVHTKYCKEIK